MSVLKIDYQSEHFPASSISNGFGQLTTNWDEIIWSAVTVGRPNRAYVFRHGIHSLYEAIFRLSLVRMAIEQRAAGQRLRRTEAYKTLDPTEKGAISYFLGLTFCKLFSWKLLNTPWLLHLDVFRPQLDPVLRGRSRPDLVGQTIGQTDWLAFEAKGRASNPSYEAKEKAKDQADRLISVSGVPCTLHIGAFTYFRDDVLNFYWVDPEPNRQKKIEIDDVGEAWSHYYAPFSALIRRDARNADFFKEPHNLMRIPEADVEIGLHPKLVPDFIEGNWTAVREISKELVAVFSESGYNPDGLKVKAGKSWYLPFDDEGNETAQRK